MKKINYNFDIHFDLEEKYCEEYFDETRDGWNIFLCPRGLIHGGISEGKLIAEVQELLFYELLHIATAERENMEHLSLI